jgi:regulator of protease activity HflC (stomatin/prohibitin superfamily)
MIKKKFAAMLVVPLLAFTACGVSTPPDSTKVQVGAGPFEDAKFKGCIAPSTKKNSPTNDNYYAYPANERDLDATGQEGSDYDSITVLSKDNAEMKIPVTLRFNMVGDCEALQEFHKAYGSRYAAYLNDDGTSSEGWMLMLRKLMYDPADATLDEIAKKYTWREMLNNASAQNEIQSALVDNIDEIVATNARGQYFENFTVLMKKPYPADEALRQAVAAEQQSVATAQSAEAEARAQKLQAEAEVAVAEAQARKKAAEIKGYGGYDNYSRSQAIENGLNPYQPTYIVPGTKP